MVVAAVTVNADATAIRGGASGGTCNVGSTARFVLDGSADNSD